MSRIMIPYNHMKQKPLAIVYEDNHLLAVTKPSGLLIQGDRSGDVTLLEEAKDYLQEKYRKPGNVFLGLVHRLDRPVSGVVLFARTSKAARRLGKQFREGRVIKTYLAVVDGVPGPGETVAVAYLAPRADKAGRTRAERRPFPGAKEARLSYHVQDAIGGMALVEVQLYTGRRHQIRVQLSMLGHPIVGDVKYGFPTALPDRSIGLHASQLVVAHPISSEAITLVSPLPAGWPWPPRI